MTEDPAGTLWLGSADGQLLRVSGDQLVAEPSVKESRRCHSAIVCDADGVSGSATPVTVWVV